MSPKPVHVRTDVYDETNKRLSLFMRTRLKSLENLCEDVQFEKINNSEQNLNSLEQKDEAKWTLLYYCWEQCLFWEGNASNMQIKNRGKY